MYVYALYFKRGTSGSCNLTLSTVSGYYISLRTISPPTPYRSPPYHWSKPQYICLKTDFFCNRLYIELRERCLNGEACGHNDSGRNRIDSYYSRLILKSLELQNITHYLYIGIYKNLKNPNWFCNPYNLNIFISTTVKWKAECEVNKVLKIWQETKLFLKLVICSYEFPHCLWLSEAIPLIWSQKLWFSRRKITIPGHLSAFKSLPFQIDHRLGIPVLCLPCFG